MGLKGGERKQLRTKVSPAPGSSPDTTDTWPLTFSTLTLAWSLRTIQKILNGGKNFLLSPPTGAALGLLSSLLPLASLSRDTLTYSVVQPLSMY